MLFNVKMLLKCENLVYLIVLIFSSLSWAQNVNITLPLNKTTTIMNKELYGDFLSIQPNSTVQVSLEKPKKNVSYIIFQVHSHLHNITLYTNVKNSKTGLNVGLYSSAVPMIVDKFYIMNKNPLKLVLYISIHGYRALDPIPGGCALVDDTIIAPYMHANYFKDYIYVDVPPPQDHNDVDCQDKDSTTGLKFYSMYLPEREYDADTYFEGIRKMITLENIMENGVEIPKTRDHWIVRRMLSAYTGLGSVYVAVAQDVKNKNIYSIYVPTHSYACSPLMEDCDYFDDFLSQIFCATLLFIGLFICYFGHRFFKTEMFLVGMFAGIVLTYICMNLLTHLETPGLLGVSFLSGLFFGAIWLLFWWLFGIPVLAVLLSTLHVGFLLAAIIYYRVPTTHVLQNNTNFWIIFLLITFLTSFTLLTATFLSNIVCCAVLGAYATVFAMDHYVGSSLKYVFVNTLRRATVKDFNFAVLEPPFQWRDGLLTAIWIVLAATGFAFQHYHNRGRPPFPPPPRSISPRGDPITYGSLPNNRRSYVRIPNGVDAVTQPPNTTEPVIYSETTPLLANF